MSPAGRMHKPVLFPNGRGMVISSFVSSLILRDCMGWRTFVLLLLFFFLFFILTARVKNPEVKKVGGNVCTRLCAAAWLLAGGGAAAPVVSSSKAVSVPRGVRVFSLPLFFLFT